MGRVGQGGAGRGGNDTIDQARPVTAIVEITYVYVCMYLPYGVRSAAASSASQIPASQDRGSLMRIAPGEVEKLCLSVCLVS